MGTSSKIDTRKRFISTKPLKQWCKARGIDFREHCKKHNLKLSGIKED
jgi:hypothetical protein